jgi:HEPN domain-containing protein
MNPKGVRKVPGSPGEWIDRAKSDIRLAHLAANDVQVRREQACFHAQQAAEKAIKAVLRSRQIEFPLTHDIEELLELAEKGGLTLPQSVREAGSLTPHAVESRYPGYWMEITASDVDEALRVAEQVMEWAKRMLSTSGEDER